MQNAVIVLFFALSLCLSAFADGNVTSDVNQTKQPDFRYSIGFGVINTMYFTKSSGSRWFALPYGDLRYKTLFLSLRGAGADLPLGGGVILSPTFGYRGGRDDDGSLKGMGVVDAEATYGASISLMRPRVVLGASFFRGFSSGSATYGINVGFPFALGDNWTISPALSAQFGDRKYNQAYYGVSARQAARTRYDPYEPNGGLTGISTALAISYRITKKLSANLFIRHTRFVDQAAKSPLTKDGAYNQNNFGAIIVYKPR